MKKILGGRWKLVIVCHSICSPHSFFGWSSKLPKLIKLMVFFFSWGEATSCVKESPRQLPQNSGRTDAKSSLKWFYMMPWWHDAAIYIVRKSIGKWLSSYPSPRQVVASRWATPCLPSRRAFGVRNPNGWVKVGIELPPVIKNSSTCERKNVRRWNQEWKKWLIDHSVFLLTLIKCCHWDIMAWLSHQISLHLNVDSMETLAAIALSIPGIVTLEMLKWWMQFSLLAAGSVNLWKKPNWLLFFLRCCDILKELLPQCATCLFNNSHL